MLRERARILTDTPALVATAAGLYGRLPDLLSGGAALPTEICGWYLISSMLI